MIEKEDKERKDFKPHYLEEDNDFVKSGDLERDIKGKTILAEQIIGKFRTVTAIPTAEPTRFIGQIVAVTAGGSTRLYFFDYTARKWNITN